MRDTKAEIATKGCVIHCFKRVIHNCIEEVMNTDDVVFVPFKCLSSLQCDAYAFTFAM